MNYNKKNTRFFFVILIAGLFVFCTDKGVFLVDIIYSSRILVRNIIAVIIGALFTVKALEMFREQGTGLFSSSGFQFFGPVGDLLLQAFSIFTIMYSGFVIMSLITLNRLSEVPKDVLPFLSILVFFLFIWGGMHLLNLSKEVFGPKSIPAKAVIIHKNDELSKKDDS